MKTVSAFLIALLLPIAAYTQVYPCGWVEDNERTLKEKFQQVPVGAGYIDEAAQFRIYVAPDGKTWTAMIVTADGLACLVQTGEPGVKRRSQRARGHRMFTARDIEIAARTIFGEARDQSWLGKVGVGFVIRRRVDLDLHDDGKPDWWGEGYEGVCLKAWQFSCWNVGDPNRDKLLSATTADPAFRECLAAAAAVLGSLVTDPTGRASHYKVTSLPWPKDWGNPIPPVAVIGAHSFYRLEG